MKIGIGIDTGGTYTDAVIYNFTTKEILATAKALTTKEDLSIGILETLDALPPDTLKQAEIISLSTTLATNACVEDRGGNAKLIFLGGDAKVIDQNGKNYGLPPSADMYIQESFTKFSGEIERDMDWEKFSQELENGYDNLDGVGIIEINAMRNGAVIEKRAKEIFQARHDIPVICSHELFNELNCLQRGASTLLNARLVPVIREFLVAIKKAMALRSIKASIAIVRSDGGLMSEEFAHIRPVETLLCGPAASVLGSSYLARQENTVVIDMGGTTTDIAIVEKGAPVTATNGVSIGKWKTFVSGLYINTFGLGGDTAIRYRGGSILLEDFRIVPLCTASAKYPQIVDKLKTLPQTPHTHYLHEFFILVKDISENSRFSADEKLLCAALKNGPLSLQEAAELITGRDIYNFNAANLIKEGIVQICGLTPTDIMHIKGDFTKYPTEASLLGASFVAANIGVTVPELCDMVYDQVKRKLYVSVAKILHEHKTRKPVGEELLQFIGHCYDNPQSDTIAAMFSTKFTLTGVGAPIKIFLHDVAKRLDTTAVTPTHNEVANALGAIVGNVHATATAEIRPVNDMTVTVGYKVFGNSCNVEFKTMEEAEAFAIEDTKNAAREEYLRRGIVTDEITVTHTLVKNEAPARDGIVHLGTKVVATAVGGLL